MAGVDDHSDVFRDLLSGFEEQETARRDRIFEHLYREHENFAREGQGLEPLPPLEYTDLDRENDIHTLTVTLPALRSGPGWTGEEAESILAAWEEEALENLSTSQGERQVPEKGA